MADHNQATDSTDSEQQTGHGYRCENCFTDDEGKKQDKIRDGVNSYDAAKVLARIHAVKTGHDPEPY